MKTPRTDSTTHPRSNTKSTSRKDPTDTRRRGCARRWTRLLVRLWFIIGLAVVCVLIACRLCLSTEDAQLVPNQGANPLKEPPTPSITAVEPSAQPSVRPTPVEALEEPEVEVVAKYSSAEVTIVCQTVWGEARGCSPEEQALVAWCICNWVDYQGTSIAEVVTHNRFHGFDEGHPVTPEIYEVVTGVLEAWARGEEALVYPPYATTPNYLFFGGDGLHNWFREEY